jgi:hypothetical protein
MANGSTSRELQQGRNGPTEKREGNQNNDDVPGSNDRPLPREPSLADMVN